MTNFKTIVESHEYLHHLPSKCYDRSIAARTVTGRRPTIYRSQILPGSPLHPLGNVRSETLPLSIHGFKKFLVTLFDEWPIIQRRVVSTDTKQTSEICASIIENFNDT